MHWIRGAMGVIGYLVVNFLREDTALSDDQVEGSTSHQGSVAHVTKHDRKQEREGDDGVRCWRKEIMVTCCGKPQRPKAEDAHNSGILDTKRG